MTGTATRHGYGIIYADPPWSYRTWSKAGQGRSAASHYRTMPTNEIAAIPVRRLAAPDCALFLWATCPNLPDALAVMGAWGFRYVTVAFVWVKASPKGSLHWGMGYWSRSNAELCLLGARGRPKRRSASVHQVVMAPAGAHSAKPAEVRERITSLMGGLPRVELFARERAEGWDAAGEDLDGTTVERFIGRSGGEGRRDG